MEIIPNKTALLAYELTLADSGDQIEIVPEDKAAPFHFGTNQLLPGFEKNLCGKKAGDHFNFVLSPDEAYGPTDPYAIFDISKDTFEVDGKTDEKMLQIGNVIPMTDDQGVKHLGKITKILDEAVTLDFNHPLAGKPLRFKGKVIEVK